MVDVPPRIQAERLARERGMSKDQAEARMLAQASREERLAIATIVVDNSGSLAELDREAGRRAVRRSCGERALAAQG